ncbi:MAG: DUF262 domain-containing protein [Coriobacteriia bacterium]|nr:DUF262 domain-containing protein [Coriobacteriia bacterium]
MQINQLWFLDFTGQPQVQFLVPRYQRVYSWLTVQCEELWEDVMRCGRDQISHFISTTLYLDAGVSENGVRRMDIIDGQQRIASVTILLTALRDYMAETGTVLECEALANQESGAAPHDYDPQALHDRFLTVQDGDVVSPKIQLIGPDKTTLYALVMRTPLPERVSTRVKENYEYFLGRMREEGFDARVLWNGLRELLVIATKLGEGDRPQAIFESLNTKGLPLTAADLIRNYLLVAETQREQQRLYTEYWQPMEMLFRDDSNSTGSLKFNTGLRMWLTIRCKRMCISDRTRTFHYFKIYMNALYDGTAEELLDELRSFCYLWSKNYELNSGRAHCSKFAWAKKSKGNTLIPPMARTSDITRMLKTKTREETLLEAMKGQNRAEQGGEVQMCSAPGISMSAAGYETLEFGRWGGQPIVWRVLERGEAWALVIAEKVLDSVPYHSHYIFTTWADCFLRDWANDTFVAQAFSAGEALRLMDNEIHTADDGFWETMGGPDCNDRVFLLSKEEAARYFADASERMAQPTEHALLSGVYVEDGYCLWWLRSPGHGQGFASTVWPVGGLDTAGSGVGRPGVGFRPVIRVRL